MKNSIFLRGYLNIHDFKKCYNIEQKSWIFITITDEFEKITDFNINKLKELSKNLDSNNEEGIYFFDEISDINEFVISNNNYVVYIEDFDIKSYADFGLADSCAMYSLIIKSSTDNAIKAELEDLYKTCFEKLTLDQQDNLFSIN